MIFLENQWHVFCFFWTLFYLHSQFFTYYLDSRSKICKFILLSILMAENVLKSGNKHRWHSFAGTWAGCITWAISWSSGRSCFLNICYLATITCRCWQRRILHVQRSSTHWRRSWCRFIRMIFIIMVTAMRFIQF